MGCCGGDDGVTGRRWFLNGNEEGLYDLGWRSLFDSEGMELA